MACREQLVTFTAVNIGLPIVASLLVGHENTIKFLEYLYSNEPSEFVGVTSIMLWIGVNWLTQQKVYDFCNYLEKKKIEERGGVPEWLWVDSEVKDPPPPLNGPDSVVVNSRHVVGRKGKVASSKPSQPHNTEIS